jgi:hypothetical protein
VACAIEAVREGVYLTDGERLCEVVGLSEDGKFMLADCSAHADEVAPMIRVDKTALVTGWKVVGK